MPDLALFAKDKTHDILVVHYFDASTLELVGLGVGLMLVGVVAGWIGGLFGVGGGAVLVPVLYQFFIILGVDESVCMQLAVGTSLGVIIPTSLRSFQTHMKHDAVDFDYLRQIALWIILGVLLGSLAARFVSGSQLRAVFAVLTLLMAIKILFSRDDFRFWESFPPLPVFRSLASSIGFFSVLMGIGGGVFNTILMTSFGRSIHRAIATSAGVGLLISVPGVVGFMLAGWGQENMASMPAWSLGFVSLPGIAAIIPASIGAAPYGARLAHRLSKQKLQKAFAVFLLFVSCRFFISLI